jgi:hypothetical protein
MFPRQAWGAIGVPILGLCVWSGFAGDVAGRVPAFIAGGLLGLGFAAFAIGGLRDKAEGETAELIERLGREWHCEHDLAHGQGSWEHILVGPAGVFVLDSKYLHNEAEVRDDALHSGRLRFAGSTFRIAAWRVKSELEGRGAWPRWVQAVVVVWGEFPQRVVEERHVIYVAADELLPWLESLPSQLPRPKWAGAIAGLREMREALGAAA